MPIRRISQAALYSAQRVAVSAAEGPTGHRLIHPEVGAFTNFICIGSDVSGTVRSKKVASDCGKTSNPRPL